MLALQLCKPFGELRETQSVTVHILGIMLINLNNQRNELNYV